MKKIKKKEKIRKEEGGGNKDCKREEDKNYKKGKKIKRKSRKVKMRGN